VRVVGDDGNQLGVLTTRSAMEAAMEAGLDLVEVSPNADPPVCKIMDFGKYKFQLNKKQHEAKKKQKIVHIKEIKFRPCTEDGDYQVKLKKILTFITRGDKVKVTIRFRGREMSHKEIGFELIKRVTLDTEEFALVEQVAKTEGRQMMMVLAPKKT
jgi:translation initiation factor IF-3